MSFSFNKKLSSIFLSDFYFVWLEQIRKCKCNIVHVEDNPSLNMIKEISSSFPEFYSLSSSSNWKMLSVGIGTHMR